MINRTILWPSNSTYGYLCEDNKNTYLKRYPPLPMFVATLFVIAKIWKQPGCSSLEGWIQQMWPAYAYYICIPQLLYLYSTLYTIYNIPHYISYSIHNMENYLTVKKNGILPRGYCASQISQREKDKYHGSHLYIKSRK